MNLAAHDSLCHNGIATSFPNLYGIDDSGRLRSPDLTLGFRDDTIVLEPWMGTFIVNALEQDNRRVGRGCIHDVYCASAGR